MVSNYAVYSRRMDRVKSQARGGTGDNEYWCHSKGDFETEMVSPSAPQEQEWQTAGSELLAKKKPRLGVALHYCDIVVDYY